MTQQFVRDLALMGIQSVVNLRCNARHKKPPRGLQSDKTVTQCAQGVNAPRPKTASQTRDEENDIADRELRALLETVGPEVCDELLAETAADP